jgi:hypothetical protein
VQTGPFLFLSPAKNLLRSASRVLAVLKILTYEKACSGFCAPAAHILPSLATILRGLHQG